MAVVAAAVICVGSLLCTTDLFPDCFEDLRARRSRSQGRALRRGETAVAEAPGRSSIPSAASRR